MEEKIELSVELTDSELKIIESLRNGISALQQQLNVAFSMAFASRNIEKFNVLSIDGKKVTYN